MANGDIDRESERDDTEAGWYAVDFRVHRNLVPDGEPDEFVLEICGDLVQHDGEGGPGAKAGRVHAYIVQASRALEAGYSIWDACDSVNDVLSEVYAALYSRREGELKRTLSDGGAGIDALVLESAEILPDHRGRRLGQLLILRTIEDFGAGLAVAALKPFPLQLCGRNDPNKGPRDELTPFRKALRLDKFDQDSVRSTARLRKYWGELGFKRIRGSEWFSLDLQCRRKTFGELLGD